jgi:hypothetical protein
MSWNKRELKLKGAKGDQSQVTRLNEMDAKLAANGRCKRCYLLLPCVCLGSATDLAERRTESGNVWPEGGW